MTYFKSYNTLEVDAGSPTKTTGNWKRFSRSMAMAAFS
jgi:hypothetical protein